MVDLIDRAQAVRPGEAFSIDKLQAFVNTKLPHLNGPMIVKQFPNGYSNLTYLIQVGETELVLRRPPFGARIKTAHDMEREFRILSSLVKTYAHIPRPLVYCEDESVIGAPFYLMQRVRGVILRKDFPSGLDLNERAMQALSSSFIDNLVDIHRIDGSAAGLDDLGHPQGYVKRQIEGWTKRYFNAKTDDVPEVERAAKWLIKNMPPESGAVLIHNDYKYDNLILSPNDFSILAVVDWEMATVGDPLMDLGTSLGYWIDPDDPEELQSMRFGPTTLPGNLSRTQLVERYSDASGMDASDALFYYVYGLFKIVVIIQQIYKRFKMGHSKDERFASLIEGVRALGKVTVLAIEKQRINHLV